MQMPGQTWLGAGASFLAMWVVMMVAMMLPSLVPMLRRYRQAVGRTGETRLGWLTALVGAGYFFVWTVFGMAAYPLGVALAAKSSTETPKKALSEGMSREKPSCGCATTAAVSLIACRTRRGGATRAPLRCAP